MKKSLFFILILLLATCQDDFIDRQPITSITSSNFFQTEADALSAVVAIYDVLQFEFDGSDVALTSVPSESYVSAGLYHLGDFVSDDVLKGGNSDADLQDVFLFSNFEGNSASGSVLAVWNTNYQGIARSNFAIEGITPLDESIFSSPELKARFIAEARFLRAFYYFNLVKVFGGVVLFRQTPVPSEYNSPRSSVEECWTFIENELSESAADLPRKSELTLDSYGRVTWGAAMSFLARSHLYQQDYAAAKTAAQAVINSGEYSLIDNYQTVFEVAGEHGDGSIFEVNFSSELSPGGWPPNTSQGTILHTWFRCRGTCAGADIGWSFGIPTQDLYDEFEINDARRGATIIADGDVVYGQTATTSHAYTLQISPNGYHNRKFRLRPEEEPRAIGVAGDPQNAAAPINLRLMRYADVLLVYAEASARTGDEAGALDALNQVRTRARNFAVLQNPSLAGNNTVLPDRTSNGEQLIDDILHERRVELAMEGHRFFDLARRPNGAGSTMRAFGKTNFDDGVHNLFPIPISAINTTGGAVVQNPGY